MKKTLFFLLLFAGILQAFPQNFDGKFINPKADSLLLVIQPEPVIVLDTFNIAKANHYGNSPYVGLLKITTSVTGLYQFKSGQYYTLYEENGEQKTRWLGWLTGNYWLGNTVMRDSRNTQHWIIRLDEKGLPYREMLPDWAQPKTE